MFLVNLRCPFSKVTSLGVVVTSLGVVDGAGVISSMSHMCRGTSDIHRLELKGNVTFGNTIGKLPGQMIKAAGTQVGVRRVLD